MTIEVKVPVLPESVEDAIIATWHKQPGDTVHRDDKLVDLETDKVVLEVPAPADGTLKEIKSAEGDTVHSADLLAIIEEGAVEAVTAAATQAETEPDAASQSTAARQAPAPEPARASAPCCA